MKNVQRQDPSRKAMTHSYWGTLNSVSHRNSCPRYGQSVDKALESVSLLRAGKAVFPVSGPREQLLEFRARERLALQKLETVPGMQPSAGPSAGGAKGINAFASPSSSL